MRNIFDQYDQPENKLTHALYCTLAQDRSLLRPFLAWLGIESPPLKDLGIVQQQLPGVMLHDDDGEGTGLPDLCVYTDDGWAVLFEMKVQSKLTTGQLQRHLATAKRYGFDSPHLVAITVEAPTAKLPYNTISKQWRDLYSWFDQRKAQTIWPEMLVRYFETFESKAIANEYDLRGTITMFNGLPFNDDNPYSYREAKRLMRLLGDELQLRQDLKRVLGVDPGADRRTAITNDAWGVWDYLPLKVGRGKAFTRFPHLTIGLRHTIATASATVPNGVSGGFRTKLKEIQIDGFLDLAREIEKRLRTVTKRSRASIPFMYATQRHYRSQRSSPTVDGRIEVDLRTCVRSGKSDVKYQPEWAESLYHLLINKRSNIQFGVEMRFDYDCKVLQSKAAVDLFAESWMAMKPLLDFVLYE